MVFPVPLGTFDTLIACISNTTIYSLINALTKNVKSSRMPFYSTSATSYCPYISLSEVSFGTLNFRSNSCFEFSGNTLEV